MVIKSIAIYKTMTISRTPPQKSKNSQNCAELCADGHTQNTVREAQTFPEY